VTAHDVIDKGDRSATCRCGEVFHAETYQRARLDHVRHAFENRHDTPPPEEPDPF
jgi:hypothetical protein